MSHNQQPPGAGAGLTWEEQQMQMAMALSMGVQQAAPAAASPAGSASSGVSAADVAAALASVTAASPSQPPAGGGLTQEKLEAALAAAAAAAAAGGGAAASGGAVRPRPPASTALEPAAAAAMKAIFDGIAIGESALDSDELERAVKRRATQAGTGPGALEYLATAHARAADDSLEPAVKRLAVEITLGLGRGLLAEGGGRDFGDVALALDTVMKLPPAFLEALLLRAAAGGADQWETPLAAPLQAAARAVQSAKLDDPSVDPALDLFKRLVVQSPAVCTALVLTIENEARQARRSGAHFFERSTVCGVLSISPMALARIAASELSPQFSALEQYAPNPGQNGATKAISEMMASIWGQQHNAFKKLVASKHAGPGVAREAVLSWFSALFDLQTVVRGVPGALRKRSRSSSQRPASHGMMLNTMQVLLELSAPFCGEGEEKTPFFFERFPYVCPEPVLGK